MEKCIETLFKDLTSSEHNIGQSDHIDETIYLIESKLLLDSTGIPHRFVKPKYEKALTEEHTWDGNILTLKDSIKSYNLLHEIAHNQVASPRRRRKPEYGLGQSPESFLRANFELKFESCEEEERLASILGILWERKLGHNFYSTLRSHCWLEVSDKVDRELKGVLKTLNKYGLIDKQGVPQLAFR